MTQLCNKRKSEGGGGGHERDKAACQGPGISFLRESFPSSSSFQSTAGIFFG